MKIVHGGRMPFTERNNPRGGTFHYKRLVEGDAGSPGNFGLMLSRTYENFVSPRHRHNFEQIRFQLEGVSSFGRDGAMTPGTMGYFPEGAFYGPQSADGPALVLVLQYGGPSGSGYMSEDELQQSVRALSAVGEFREGVFHRSSGEGRARQDAYEAAWENRQGRRLEYPEPRYPGPVLVPGESVDWAPVADGVAAGVFGRFKGGTAASLVRVTAGGSSALEGRCVAFVLSGSGEIGGEAVTSEAAVAVEAGESVSLAGDLDVLVMELPLVEALV
jgi:hypothetical protein